MRHAKITVNEHDVVLSSTVGKRQKTELVEAWLAVGWRKMSPDSGEGSFVGHFISLPDILSLPHLC